ncbi:MAG: hypothetical protein Athens041674_952 [Parcubacteria group bacterium Athens0416_74]|nr:MAG: hypothetical protein Athens041674_952 [Parcubacteria group bacterium Athens0416_74]
MRPRARFGAVANVYQGERFARASRIAVALLGLGTASLFGLLALHRSGVRIPLAMCAGTSLPSAVFSLRSNLRRVRDSNSRCLSARTLSKRVH